MKMFFKQKSLEIDGANISRNLCPVDINWEEKIKLHLGMRREIDSYHPNHRENVRRKYLENGRKRA